MENIVGSLNHNTELSQPAGMRSKVSRRYQSCTSLQFTGPAFLASLLITVQLRQPHLCDPPSPISYHKAHLIFTEFNSQLNSVHPSGQWKLYILYNCNSVHPSLLMENIKSSLLYGPKCGETVVLVCDGEKRAEHVWRPGGRSEGKTAILPESLDRLQYISISIGN